MPTGIPAALSDEFASDAAKQAQWLAFVSKSRLDAIALSDVAKTLRAAFQS